MLKRVLIASLLAMAPLSAAQAQTIVLIPEAGSMSPPTVIVDPRASKNDPVLVCVSMAQLSAGGCTLRSVTQGGSRRN
ncbi:MAG TPA: hypothetical protein VF631_06565 [Allosphingosinicella sp.]|jgi:hypothetical protein|uniref:hypothetical protein n=1 Tax=Allosphingosinicella sp. TaxID=2823234 RepID=UPI002F28B1E9